MKKKRIIMVTGIGVILLTALFLGWNNTKQTQKDTLYNEQSIVEAQSVGPNFQADSAYAYIKTQCNFGARTMNSVAHKECAEWIIKKFQQFGCSVTTQQVALKGYDGTILQATNIMAQYKPKEQKRIMLCAHWDSRPWADNDPDSTNWHKPVMAANDGASGVAVMLEVARLLKNDTTLAYGIDFVCFDAEDWGTPQWEESNNSEDSWALGAQYWAKNKINYQRPQYAILLDMVGGEGAKFYQELASKQYALHIVDKVWNAAHTAGYGSYFIKQEGGYITDDHIPLNKYAKIPTIDIIPYYPDCPQSSFGPTWHTIYDTIEHIDKNTLKAVGQTIIQVLFSE